MEKKGNKWMEYYMYKPLDENSIEIAHTIYDIDKDSLRKVSKMNHLSNLEDLMAYLERNEDSIKKQSSMMKKAEEESIEELSELEKAEKEIKETPINELLTEETPLDYFKSNTESTKTKSTTDKVNECITALINHFSDFNRFFVKILSYEVKLYDNNDTDSVELIDDPQINCDAMLQIILSISSMADLSVSKKALTVFTIKNEKVFWAGTIRTENDNVIAFSDENLDILFEEKDSSEDLI